jgi:hypothetical protein
MVHKASRVVNIPPRFIGSSFWIRWVIASTVGIGAGVLLWLAAGGAMDALGIVGQTVWARALQGGAVGAAFGTPFGVGQWLVLRRGVEHSGRWITATAIGYAIVFVLGAILVPDGEGLDLAPAATIALGALIGAAVAVPAALLQWLFVLRRQFPGAGWWIPGSVFSWAIGFAISFALRLWLGELSFTAGPVVAIGLSGLVLVRLLQRRAPPSSIDSPRT